MKGRLDAHDEALALDGGAQRQAFADGHGIRDLGHFGFNPGEAEHVCGCRGEIFLARATGLPWSVQAGVLDGVDVGGRIEVRTRRVPGTGQDLPLRPKDRDKPNLPFVLIHAHAGGDLEIVGWLYGHEMIKRDGFVLHGVKFIPPPYRSPESLLATYRKLRSRCRCLLCRLEAAA